MIFITREGKRKENHADILLLPECFVTGYDLPVSSEKKEKEVDDEKGE